MPKSNALPISIPSPERIASGAVQYTPSMAIIIHKGNNGSRHSSESAMLTLHPVMPSRQGAPHIGPGKVMGEQDGRTIGNLLLKADASRAHGHTIPILPANVLTIERDALTWLVPARRATMHSIDGKGQRHSFDVCWPNLVLRVVRRKLYIVAVESAARPDARTRLFAAPLPNLYSNTSLCTGSATLPRTSDVESIPKWESVLFRSFNTHVNHEKTLKGGASSDQLFDFWKRRVGKRSPPSARNFTPLAMTLGQWLSQTQSGNDDDR
jgi:PRTRC genetic system protein B